ncbi:MAG: fibronectin type III domain-containing protein, partial [Bacteroidales bacterium]|nr:fibronectin type III domain-containing protein [Bacteroidales bacterium]
QSSWVTGSTVTDPVACNTPTAIAANNITCSTAVVSWSGSASSYEVSYKLAAASVWSTPAASSSSSMTLSDLTSSSSYNVRIRAVCSANSHSAWATSTFTTGEAACPDPTSLTASNSSNTITISWSGSASSYDVSYKLHDATNWNSSVSTVNTTYTFTGLTDSTTYDYRVRGNCSSSNQSTWVSGTVTTDPVLCNTPTAVAATNITPSSALITWSGSADSYQLCYKAADSVLWSSPITLASTNYTLSGLEGLTNYQVRVRAECSANSHSTWSTSNFTTLEPPCSPVTNLSESHTATSLTISWMGDADSYQVAYKQFDATSWSSAITVSGFSYTWTGLTSATQYEYRVRSYCSSTNYSEWVSASATLSDSSCTAPSGLATTSTSSFITLSWLSDADSFQVAIKEQSSTSWNASIAESAHSHTFSGLSDSTMYMLRVRAICTSTAQSDWVTISESTLSIVCDQVTNLSVSDVDAQSALVAWQGSAAGYELQYKASDATIWNDVIYTSSLNYQLTGLNANVAYDVHVRAACSDHSHSSWSSISFTTSDSSSDCEVPYDITVLVDRTSAYIYWMGDANVYEFQYRYADDEDGWTMLQEISSYSITLMPLEPEQAYDFRLRSKCDDDNVSDWVLIPFTTLDRHWGLFPTDVTVSNVTDHSAQFQWSPAYDESDWSVHVVGGNLDSIFYTSTNPVICSNLRPNTTYSVSVAALWDGAISDWSEEVFFTTGTSAICEHLQISTVSIYPNPASYTTTITLSGIQGEVLLEIVDNNGRQLMNQSFLSSGNNDFLLDISDLAAGIYFVRLSHQGQQTVTKLIVR